MTTQTRTVIHDEPTRFDAGHRLTEARERLSFYESRAAEGLASRELVRQRELVTGLEAEISRYDAEVRAEVERQRLEAKARLMAGHIERYREAAPEFEAAQEDLIRAAEGLATALERFRDQAAGLDRLETAATGKPNGDRIFTDQQRIALTYVARLLYRTPLVPFIMRHQSGLDAPRPVFTPAAVWTPQQDSERAEAARLRAEQEATCAAELAARPTYLYGTPSQIGEYFAGE